MAIADRRFRRKAYGLIEAMTGSTASALLDYLLCHLLHILSFHFIQKYNEVICFHRDVITSDCVKVKSEKRPPGRGNAFRMRQTPVAVLCRALDENTSMCFSGHFADAS